MNRQIIMTLLGMTLLAFVAIDLQRHQSVSLANSLYRAELVEAASQESAFARAVSDYVSANVTSSGTVITPSQMMSVGDLAPGFPVSNPFGQTPEAIVGTNNAVLVTYTGAPSANYMVPYNLNVASTIDMQAMALGIASDIAAMQAGLPQLTAGMLNAGNLTTPMDNQTLSASTYLPGVTLPSGPIFVDMLNILPVPTDNAVGGYGASTGD